MAIKLEKHGDTHRIDLTKGGSSSASKEIVINLNWTQKKGIWASLTKSAIDLDLGCWYELRDGSKSCIDGLQFAHGQGGAREKVTKQGCYTQKPWIWHTGDDKEGSSADGENILINPQGLSDLKRITVYTFIYEGAAKWAETNAVVTVKVPDNPDIVVEMGQQYNASTFSAIAEINFGTDNSMTVKKLVTFHSGHSDCDRMYNWGMQWRAGSK